MKTWMKIGLTAVVGAALLASDVNAGLFNRRAYHYPRQPNAVMGERIEGHTESTGLGTAIDGNPRRTHRAYGPVAKPGTRTQGHTEVTGLGTAIDGR